MGTNRPRLPDWAAKFKTAGEAATAALEYEKNNRLEKGTYINADIREKTHRYFVLQGDKIMDDNGKMRPMPD